jgi:hypothetical protein
LRFLEELPDLRVAGRSSCCPSIAFLAGDPTRDQPHGTLVEQLVAEAGWEAVPELEVLIFSRGGQLSYMEYAHYDLDTDVSTTEFPPAGELQPRSRHLVGPSPRLLLSMRGWRLPDRCSSPDGAVGAGSP